MKRQAAHIEELEAEISARGGTLAMSEDLEDETREAFLNHVLEFEDAPETTIREALAARGREVPGDLWELIACLAEMNIVIEFTDHLDDATLFESLLAYVDESVHVPTDADTIMHVDMSSADPDIFLRYYATEADRALWRREFPNEEMPPRERLPYDRDRLLPKAEDLRAIAAVRR